MLNLQLLIRPEPVVAVNFPGQTIVRAMFARCFIVTANHKYKVRSLKIDKSQIFPKVLRLFIHAPLEIQYVLG